MKKILLILIAFYSISIVASEIDWNTTEIKSQNHFSFLEEKFNDDIYLKLKNDNNTDVTKTNLAVASWSNFRNAIVNFFSNEAIPSHFLEIQTPYKAVTSINNIPNNSIPPRSSFYFNIITGVDYFSNLQDKEHYSYVYNGTKLFANISDHLFIDGYWWSGHFTGDDELFTTSPIFDSWSQTNDDNSQTSLDNVSGKIVYKNQFGSLIVGRGTHVIGNNIGGSVILNDACNDYGYFSGKLDFSKFSISLMHGTLIPDSTNVNELGIPINKDYSDKYIAVKKIDWLPNSKLHFFAGEEVLYGGRDIDPSYLLPQTFLRATEHNLRDRDNVLIFCGMNLNPVSQNTIYLNFIFDELTKSKIFTNWWGNKYAVQLGNSYLINKEREARFTIEFTAVRPWIYTHKILHNKYSNDGIGLGFPDGSNLVQIAGEFNYKFLKNLSGNIHGSYTRQGSLGNDFTINYETRPDDTANWLEGANTEKIMLRSIIRWQPLTHHNLLIGHAITRADNNDLANTLSISYQASY
ncbi:MAG: hypothetical protein P9L97_13080 [Candidatus Tenebribacter davisii]|nr:hypothetical protein [Candidatus Tenebribacter davisii]